MLKKENITVLVSTSYMDEASLCNRIALIQKGTILNINTPTQILSEFKGQLFAIQSKEIYRLLLLFQEIEWIDNYYASGQQVNIVLNEKNNIEKLPLLLQEKNISFSHIQAIKPNTEDCFIQLMRSQQENI